MMTFIRSLKASAAVFPARGNASAARAGGAAPGRAVPLAVAVSLASLAMAGAASAAPCSVWPDKILRVNADSASSLVFLLRTDDGRVPGNVSAVGGLFYKRDPKGQCRPGDRTAACRDVGQWAEIPAIETGSPDGEYSFTLYLGNESAPFLYEGALWVQYRDGRREWLNNPADSRRNFWYTLESTGSLPRTDTWDFSFRGVPRTADIGHWSNPGRCAD